MRKRKSRLPCGDEKIIGLYEDGLTAKEVGACCGISQWAVRGVLHMHKIRLRPRLTGEKHPKRIFTDSEEGRICSDYVGGMTLKECSDKYNTNQTLISRILKRHNVGTRKTKETGKIGRYCSRYVGGRYLDHKGYVCLYMPDYKWANKGGWVKEHRYVMQNHLGRRLKKHQDVHHINGIKNDNRLENLQVMTHAKHARLHNK